MEALDVSFEILYTKYKVNVRVGPDLEADASTVSNVLNEAWMLRI